MNYLDTLQIILNSDNILIVCGALTDLGISPKIEIPYPQLNISLGNFFNTSISASSIPVIDPIKFLPEILNYDKGLNFSFYKHFTSQIFNPYHYTFSIPSYIVNYNYFTSMMCNTYHIIFNNLHFIIPFFGFSYNLLGNLFFRILPFNYTSNYIYTKYCVIKDILFCSKNKTKNRFFDYSYKCFSLYNYNYIFNFLGLGLPSYKVKLLIFALIGNFTLVRAQPSERVSIIITKLLTFLGWFVYLITNWLYDYMFIKFINNHSILFNFRNFILFNRYFIDRIILSIIFVININLGVLFSTSFWNLVQFNSLTSSIIFGVFSFALSYICVVGWIVLARLSFDTGNNAFLIWPHLNNQFFISLGRSILESIIFNFISWYSFLIWSYWSYLPISSNLINITPITTIVLYVPIGMVQVWLEHRLINPWTYGLIYQLSFALLSFNTSGFYYLYASHVGRSYLGVIPGVIINFFFPMEYYREYIRSNTIVLGNNNVTLYDRLLDYFLGALRYYLCFLAFVFMTTPYILFIPY